MLPCSGMSVFKTLRGIQQLDLTDTMVADPGMQHITRLKDLKNLSLAYSSESKCLKSLQTLSQAGFCSVFRLDAQAHCRFAHDCLPGSSEAATALCPAQT